MGTHRRRPPATLAEHPLGRAFGRGGIGDRDRAAGPGSASRLMKGPQRVQLGKKPTSSSCGWWAPMTWQSGIASSPATPAGWRDTREGDTAPLSYSVSKGPELSNPWTRTRSPRAELSTCSTSTTSRRRAWRATGRTAWRTGKTSAQCWRRVRRPRWRRCTAERSPGALVDGWSTGAPSRRGQAAAARAARESG